MSRMTREFSLVLLGAGILTAGYFAAPSPDEGLAAKADEQAAERLTGDRTSNGGYYRTHYPLFFVHSYGYSGSTTGRPSVASGGSTRGGGFGGIGRSAGAGG